MESESYKAWVSLFSDEIKDSWIRESKELRKISMIYCAFQKELSRLKLLLDDEFSQVKVALKKKERIERCKNFVGLVQSEKLDLSCFPNTEKENLSPEASPIKHFSNESLSDVFVIEDPETVPIKISTPTRSPIKDFSNSPILRKESFKRKTTPKFLTKLKKHDDSNIMESSIVEDTPVLTPEKKSKRSRLKTRKKFKLDNSKQGTLTQLFFEPTKPKQVDSNLPSMNISEMINLINEESSDTDATVDLEIPETSRNSPRKEKYEKYLNGAERQKTFNEENCKKCQKIDCEHKYPPRQETFQGFWDLSFRPTQKTQGVDEESLVLNYKK